MVVSSRRRGGKILVVDIGGTHVKAALSDAAGSRVKVPSGPAMTPGAMIRALLRRLPRSRFEAVAIGYPGRVRYGRIVSEPYHLAPGWVGFDFEKAFGRPTRIVNDAAMQALGSYAGGRMLFLGLGSGLGSAMIVEGVLQSMELAHLPYKKGRSFEEFVGEEARQRLGRKRWQREVFAVVAVLTAALEPDYVVLGGGNVRRLERLPPGVRRGDNRNAFAGGVRLWQDGGSKDARSPVPAAPGRRAVASRYRRAV